MSRRETIYAIVRSGGKQHRVHPDQVIDVERLPDEVGATVELNDVLLVAANGDTRVGRPLVDGARVVAEVVEQGRGDKIIVFKYKSKTRYRRKRGHRQYYTRLAIRQILTGDEPVEVKKPPARRAATGPAGEAAAKPAGKAATRPKATAKTTATKKAPAKRAAPPKATEAEKPKAKEPAKARTRKRSESK